MTSHTVNPVTRATRRYMIEFGVSMLAYVVAISIRHKLLHAASADASNGLLIGIALLPLVPVIFVFVAVVRLLRHTDEMYRRICVESLALAGGVTALLAVTYGLIESDRIPHLSAWWTYVTFMSAWIIATIFVRRCYR